MEVAITVEGQRGLTWDRWKTFAPIVEALGFSGLYRSDHFVDADPPDLPSLEMWVSLTWLADHTNRMRIGSLVTPLSFRHPVHTARMAKDLSELTKGRFVASPSIVGHLALALRSEDADLDEAGPFKLTEREREILIHLSGGESNKMIARKLQIAENTVKVHVKNLLKKLGLKSRVEAAVWAVSHKYEL